MPVHLTLSTATPAFTFAVPASPEHAKAIVMVPPEVPVLKVSFTEPDPPADARLVQLCTVIPLNRLVCKVHSIEGGPRPVELTRKFQSKLKD